MNLLAPNAPNTISLLHRLRLMDGVKQAETFTSSFGIHRIYVPSALGGQLRVGFGRADRDDSHELTLLSPSGEATRLDAGEHEVMLELDEDPRSCGEYIAVVQAPRGSYSLYATFEESGFARETDGTPLVPWNFWYFPFAHSRKEQTAWGSTVMDPLGHYERAFGVSGAKAWELEHHGDPHRDKPEWAGHCHNAAAASILFYGPPEQGIEHNGVHFTCEELKYFATEFIGRFGKSTRLWALKGTGLIGRGGDFHERRPSQDPVLFGRPEALGSFLEVLRIHLRDAGTALRMDLRDSTGQDHAEVWSQAVYRYTTRYWQRHETDPSLVRGRTWLYANEDFWREGGAPTGLPADVVGMGNDRRVVPNGSGRDQTLLFDIRFDTEGHISPDSNDNRWHDVRYKNADGQTVFLHAPRFAYRIEPPGTEPRVGDDGNPRLAAEHLKILLRIRETFR